MRFNLDDPHAVADAAVMVLRTHPIMIVATVDAVAQPWAVPVHQITLPEGRITWRSNTGARHSENLQTSSKMSGVLYSATAENGEVSLFLEGTGAVIEDPAQLAPILDARSAKNPSKRTPDAELLADSAYRMYVFTPTAAWLNDDTHTKTPVNWSLVVAGLADSGSSTDLP